MADDNMPQEPPKVSGLDQLMSEADSAGEGAPQAPPSITSNDIQSMPERFYEGADAQSGEGGGGGGRMRRILIIVGIVVVAAGLVVLGYFLFQQFFAASNTNENANAVVNANANLNGNTNTNGNLNANANGNTNTNGNLNANANTNTTTNTNTPVGPTKLPSTTDADSDGLTDLEEDLYGTASDQPDSDGDGYIDGKQVLASGEVIGELYLGYNPRGTGRLDTSGLVHTYNSSVQSYAILYPSTWLAQPTNANQETVLFTPAESTGEFIQTAVQENPTRMSAEQWYLSTHPSESASSLTALSINGLVGVLSADESEVYLAKDTKMYIVSYITGALTAVNYRTTFEMMYRNFRLVSGSATNTNANTNS